MAENKREFRGVWIPKSVWLDTRLNALEKIILIEIDSLDSDERGCYASNKYLSEFCQCSETKISLAISKLCELGYIYTRDSVKLSDNKFVQHRLLYPPATLSLSP